NYSKQKDEIGQLIGSASAFIVRINEVSKSMKAVADGDLTKGIKQLSENDEMGVTLKTMTDNLSRMFSNINASAERVSAGSRQVADGAQSLAQGATQQAASIEELSSSIAEIAERTKENAGMAENTARLSDTIRGDAEKGSQQMSEMILAVKEINDASHSIGNIIKTIDDIAFQTNILALNAAVEAARAGEHGKGFAVVAEEVRNLASKSAEAAKDTGDMIQNSMAKAELGSRIAGETAASLTKIASGIDESTQLIKRIAEASEEQSVDITQLNFGIDQMAQVVQQNSATAEESAAASEEMSEQSILLQELISRFRLKDDGSAKKLPAAARLRKNNPALLGKPLLM
ncbi:MAG: methyl-accepting chemotaxis protein, partial [Peptococcaceae bacterium]|nr:methyl-accepting chemotaxis protein [Peptococcaceae bacterium]